ncbi:MAG: Na/Pi cotransporter family protein [Candidatus Adiutrix sp.]|nr:Na/Pi cotransporter family protein [Candidatus Adiutrix sp.]
MKCAIILVMEWHLIIFSTLGGMGMFIYGMVIMSEALQRIAGDRLKAVLAAVSTNRVAACLTGVGVTALIQSSSATTVMLVGFVNAGLMTLTQGVGVALGAHIGTTLTAQLLAFDISEISLPAIALGSFMRLFCTSRKYKEIGGFILGFGFLFFGMITMKSRVGDFKDSTLMVQLFTQFQAETFGGRVFCVLVGAACTMVVQASSVTVGLTMALATQGLLTLPGAMALVLGDNIGTTITAELAAIKTDLSARRMARANSISNVIGATYMVLLFPFYEYLVVWLTQATSSLGPAELVVDGVKPNIARYVANAHTIFNVVNAVVMVTALPYLVRLAVAITSRGREEVEPANLALPLYLDERSLAKPPVALSLSRKEIVRMAEISQEMAAEVFPVFISRRRKDLDRSSVREEALDSLQRSIHHYLVQLYSGHNTQDEQRVITAQMAMATGLERLGDTTTNIANTITMALDRNIQFSEEALEEYQLISATALEFHHLVTSALKENRSDILALAKELEEKLDQMRETMRDKHLDRLRSGLCNVDQGLIFTDILNYFERLGDYLLKVSRAWVSQAAGL